MGISKAIPPRRTVNLMEDQKHRSGVRDMGAMSDSELEKLIDHINAEVPMEEPREDLLAYDARKKRELKEEQRSGMTLYERIVVSVREVIGDSAQRQFGKRLNDAKGLYSEVDSICDKLDERLGYLRDQQQTASSTANKLQSLAEASMEKYQRQARLVNRIEAEIAETESEYVSEVLFDTRERLREAREQLHHLYVEADKNVSRYNATHGMSTFLDEHVVELQDLYSSFAGQRNALHVKLVQWENQQLLGFGDKHAQSVRVLYEKMGTFARRMDIFINQRLGEDHMKLDPRYGIGSNGEDNETSQKWKRISSN